MIITLVTDENNWQIKKIVEAAKKMRVSLRKVNIQSYNFEKELQKLGDVIIWRSSSLHILSDRTNFISLIKQKNFINFGITEKPFTSNKFFQQKWAERFPGINAIPTFKFANKNQLKEAQQQQILTFPFIEKPEIGSKGNVKKLIKTEGQLEKTNFSQKNIYQNYITNDGDFRVMVVGGKALGAIKRIAAKGSHVNNISAGGTAVKVVDRKELGILCNMATGVASVFKLNFCGVDIIYNLDDKKYYFMEVNTVPDWKGFQAATGIDAAKELICHCKELYSRKNKSAVELVSGYYNKKNNYSKMMNYVQKGNKKLSFKMNNLLQCITEESKYRGITIRKCRNKHIKMCKEAEGIIRKNYFDIPLKIKLEFSVCSSLLNIFSPLNDIILNEADHSLSPIGNFIIDRFSAEADHSIAGSAISASHLNTLYLTARSILYTNKSRIKNVTRKS